MYWYWYRAVVPAGHAVAFQLQVVILPLVEAVTVGATGVLIGCTYVASALTGESTLVSVDEIHLAFARKPYFIP